MDPDTGRRGSNSDGRFVIIAITVAMVIAVLVIIIVGNEPLLCVSGRYLSIVFRWFAFLLCLLDGRVAEPSIFRVGAWLVCWRKIAGYVSWL